MDQQFINRVQCCTEVHTKFFSKKFNCIIVMIECLVLLIIAYVRVKQHLVNRFLQRGINQRGFADVDSLI